MLYVALQLRSQAYWAERENCEKFFLELAAWMKIDPTKVNDWYKVKRAHINVKKVPHPSTPLSFLMQS